MIKQITPNEGESLYDLSLRAYGTLDHFIKFLTDNGYANSNSVVEMKPHNYETDLSATGQ